MFGPGPIVLATCFVCHLNRNTVCVAWQHSIELSRAQHLQLGCTIQGSGLGGWGRCLCLYRYIQDCVNRRHQPSSLFEAPGFQLDFVAMDSMHCGDLGVFQDAIGGLLFLEISRRGYHRNFAQGVRWLNSQLREYYGANPALSKIHLTVSMLRPRETAHPTLKSKAAECRHLSGFAVSIAHRHLSRQFVFRNRRLAPYSAEYRTLAVVMAESLHQYHELCAALPFDQVGCRDAMLRFLKAMLDLRALFRRNLAAELHDSQPFPFKVKGHMLEHMANERLATFGSPKAFWCYADEDFVGLITRIAVGTKHPKTLEKVLLQKYQLMATLHEYALSIANE